MSDCEISNPAGFYNGTEPTDNPNPRARIKNQSTKLAIGTQIDVSL